MRQSWTSASSVHSALASAAAASCGGGYGLVLPEPLRYRDFQAVQSSHVDLPRKRHPLHQVGDTSSADQAEGEIRK